MWRELGPAVCVDSGISPLNTSLQADSSTGANKEPVVAIPGKTNAGSVLGTETFWEPELLREIRSRNEVPRTPEDPLAPIVGS